MEKYARKQRYAEGGVGGGADSLSLDQDTSSTQIVSTKKQEQKQKRAIIT